MRSVVISWFPPGDLRRGLMVFTRFCHALLFHIIIWVLNVLVVVLAVLLRPGAGTRRIL